MIDKDKLINRILNKLGDRGFYKWYGDMEEEYQEAIKDEMFEVIEVFISQALETRNKELVEKIGKIPEATRSNLESGESIICKDEIITLIQSK